MHSDPRTHRRVRRAVLPILLALTVLAAAAACGSSKTSTGGGSTASASSTGSADAAVAAANADLSKYSGQTTQFTPLASLSGVSTLKGKTVWYIPLAGSLPIFQAFGSGVKDALSAAGLTMHTCDGQLLPTDIAACLQQAQTQGAAGVIAAYIDYALAPTAYDNLIAHHIPVLVAGEAPDGGKTSTAALGFYNNASLGDTVQRLNMESVISASNGSAKILYLGVTDTATTKENADFAQTFVQQNCPKCTFKRVDYNTASLDKVASLVSAALTSNQSTNYVVDELDSGSPATISGIESAGFANKVKLASTSGNLDALQRISSGPLQVADVGYSGVYLGWQYTDGILRQMLGHPPIVGSGVIRVFTKSNVTGLTLTPAEFSTFDWYGPETFKQTFTTAWGVS